MNPEIQPRARPEGWIKDKARAACRLALSLIPFSWALRLCGLNRRLYNQLPPAHRFVFSRYHGSFCVQIDTTYPIERQMLSGEYDPGSAQVMRNYLKSGDCCLDVGANVGAHTLLMAKLVGRTGMTIAFEPGPPTFERLTQNLSLNPGLQYTVVAERLGLSDQAGMLYWNEEPHNRGNANLWGQSGTGVEVVTLDEYLARKELDRPISFVKIDVEGMEYNVLRGAEKTIKSHNPTIYFETMSGYGQFLKDRFDRDIFRDMETYLLGLGYKLFSIDAKCRLHPVNHHSFSTNTLAIGRELPHS